VIGPGPDTRSARPAASTKAINIEKFGVALPASYMVTVCTTAVSESALVAFASTGCATVSVGAGTVFVDGGGLVFTENLAGMTSNAWPGYCHAIAK